MHYKGDYIQVKYILFIPISLIEILSMSTEFTTKFGVQNMNSSGKENKIAKKEKNRKCVLGPNSPSLFHLTAGARPGGFRLCARRAPLFVGPLSQPTSTHFTARRGTDSRGLAYQLLGAFLFRRSSKM
jgi:hypothetical protein